MIGPRTRGWALWAMVGLAACSIGGHAAASAPPGKGRAIEYRVALPRPDTQYVHIDMRVAAPRGTSSDIAIPAWAPGSYLVRDFARHVYELKASTDDGAPLATTRIDKQTWRVEHRGRPFHVRYRVFAAEKSVRTSHVDDRHASLVGTSVFAFVDGELDRPCRVVVDLPSGWSAHSALESVSATAGEAVFTAPDYDRLVDAPIELGTPEVRTFEVDGAAFEYVVTGSDLAGVDIDRLVADARRIVQAQGRMMEGFPFARYVFLLELGEEGGGGLEHASSTSMLMRRTAFDDPEGYAAARRLVAHEFFHLWNVKRIHDVALGPFDYSRENHSRLLWLHEGFTETVESASLLRAGFVQPDAWLADLASDWTHYLQRPGRDHTPISELSFEAWIKAYKPADNHPNVAVSYYEKGRMIGVALDLELRLRAASHGREGSLMGLFRRLQREFGAQDKGITAADVTRAATAEAGEDMAWFFARHVDGKKDVPLPDLLRKIGIDARSHVPWVHADGKTRADAARRRTWTGLDLDKSGAIVNVVPGSPADDAALMLHDEIVAIDHVRADTRERIEALLAERGPGKEVEVALFRDGRLVTRTVRLGENPHRIWRFTLEPESTLDDRTRALRDRWLAKLP